MTTWAAESGAEDHAGSGFKTNSGATAFGAQRQFPQFPVASRSCHANLSRASLDMSGGTGDALAEAVKLGEGAATKEEAIQKALECPCVEGLKTSSCGDGFVEALSCFMRAEEHERGSKCVEQFVTLHACMVANADEFEEFTKELVENEEKEGYRAKASAPA